MNVLIAYTSFTGTAEDCAKRLAASLSNLQVELFDLLSGTPDLAPYDLVILGGSVRRGKLAKPLRDLFQNEKDALLAKPLGLFLCCGLSHEYEYYYERLLPEELRAHAFLCAYFGGDLRPKKATFWEKRYLATLRASLLESELEDFEYTPSLPGILPEAIERMAFFAKQTIDAAK